MFGFSHTPELIAVLVIALLFLGPKRLPEVGKSLGEAIRGFKRETSGFHDEFTGVRDSVLHETRGVADEVSSVKDAVHSGVGEPSGSTKIDG